MQLPAPSNCIVLPDSGTWAGTLTDLRKASVLLPGRFMVIEQAMGVPKGRSAAQAWLSAYIEEMKASGFVAEALKRHGIEGAAVAPPRTPR